MRQRKIRKIGNSFFVPILKADMEDFGITEGDKVDIEDLFFIKEKKKKK